MHNGDASRELLVLGVLRRAPLSPYAVDRFVRHHAPLYRAFRKGNVYHLVAALERAGLLARSSAAARRGPRLTKSLFTLTPLGEGRFRQLLHRTLLDPHATFAATETALVLLGQLPREDALGILSERHARLLEEERHAKRLLGDACKRRGSGFLSAAHTASRFSAERAFTRDAIRRLRSPSWERAWQADDGPIEDPARQI